MKNTQDRKTASHSRIHSSERLPLASGNETAAPQLLAIVNGSKTETNLYTSLVNWLTQQPKFAAAGFLTPSSEGSTELIAGTFDGPAFDSDQFQETVAECAQQVLQSAAISFVNVDRIRNVTLVGVPVPSDQVLSHVLTAAIVVPAGERPDDGLLMTVAAYAGLWHSRQQYNRLQGQLATTAATLDLLSTIETAESFRSGCLSLVNALRDHLKCRAFILALKRRPDSQRCQTVAMSGMSHFDAKSSIAERIEDALAECLDRDDVSIYPTDDFDNRTALLAHQKLCSELHSSSVTSQPLRTTDGRVIGAWMLVDDPPESTAEASMSFLKAASPRIADSLQLARQADSAFFNRRANGQRKTQNWLKKVACIATVAAGVLLIPVPYRIHCLCSAEPELKRFVVAPHDGLIEKTYAEPGDVVKAGQLLATMDGRDIRWELAGLVAEHEKAAKERDTGLLKGEVAAAQRASFELSRIEAREHVLLRRREQLELTAPVDGVILDGHLTRVENAPVTIGQALYEVAPLSSVTVEVDIPGEEFSRASPGMPVAVTFDGVEQTFDGVIKQIHPRSEVRNAENVFVAEVHMDNHDQKLRPGMKGYARITSDSNSLGWTLFHKPWEHLRRSLPF